MRLSFEYARAEVLDMSNKQRYLSTWGSNKFWPTNDLDNGFKDRKTVSQMLVSSENGVFSRKYMEQKKSLWWMAHVAEKYILIYSIWNKEKKSNDLEEKMENKNNKFTFWHWSI